MYKLVFKYLTAPYELFLCNFVAHFNWHIILTGKSK